MQRPSKSSEKRRVFFKSFKHSLKTLFFNKPAFIFLVAFLLANFIFFMQYVEALKSFALLEKAFTIADAQKVHTIDLLSNNFTCETKTTIPDCDNYINTLFILFILLESFLVYLFIKNRKIISKKILIGNSIFLQLFLVLPLIVVVYAPYRTFNILGQQANKEIINSISLLNNKENLEKSDIKYTLNTIRTKMGSEENLPILLEDDPKEQAILQVLGVTQNTKDSLYKVAIIPYQVYYAPEIIPQKNKIDFEVFLFPNNTLIVQSINRNLVEQLAPVLAGKLVKTKFHEYVKFVNIAPVVDAPEEKEYILIRKREDEKIKRRYEESIAYLDNYIRESAEIIQANQSIINSYPSNKQRFQKMYEDYIARLGNWYQECKSELGDEPFCEEGKSKIDNNIKILKENIEAVEADKNQAEQNLKLQTIYKNEAIGELNNVRQNYQDFLENPVTAETEGGVFLSPNTIHLKYKFAEKYPFSYYLFTATHEHLHFYSYKTKDLSNELPTFIDEGITDYLTSIVIDDFLGKQTQYIGYLNEVEIIKRFISEISEDKLKKIYFSKNEYKLEEFIDNTFPKGRYKQIKAKGNLLSLTMSTDKETQESLKRNILELLLDKEASSSNNAN